MYIRCHTYSQQPPNSCPKRGEDHFGTPRAWACKSRSKPGQGMCRISASSINQTYSAFCCAYRKYTHLRAAVGQRAKKASTSRVSRNSFSRGLPGRSQRAMSQTHKDKPEAVQPVSHSRPRTTMMEHADLKGL